MKPVDRRTFLAGGAAAALLSGLEYPAAASQADAATRSAGERRDSFDAAVDFRYAPADYQSTLCFPDDPAKTLIGKRGDLRYDFPHDQFAAIHQFGTIVEFTLSGMARGTWAGQTMEAPGAPIVHTRFEWPTATVELIAFCTRREEEGRVDNVLMEIRARDADVTATPLVRLRSCDKFQVKPTPEGITSVTRGEDAAAWMICIPQNNAARDVSWLAEEGGYRLTLEHGAASRTQPLRYLFRFPQSGADGRVDVSASPDALLAEVRTWWAKWQAYNAPVAWSIPGAYGDFLTACARNIQQAREVKNGRLVFEVGPTVYRGLWIVDGNFLLEAARYLGFDDAADQGLLSEWNQQVPTGQIIASGGKEHWKDTAIAMFTLVRACELKQDWSLLRRLAPNVGHAIEFLIQLRDDARKGDSPNGRYGLLAPGFPDGGIGGICYDFTNTLWALAGLRAVARANEKLNMAELSRAGGFYRELRSSFDTAARAEMVEDARGFAYLPMLMRDDPQMHADEWDRPRPQSAQWALSHTICPGEVFAKDDPIVRGHIALMQACTQEDIPAETGWLHHEGVWNYNAAFAAEVYLWAGMREWAQRTFTGYLNHASPLRAWREEQPLQHALVGDLWGDMPHNWASAECIRYLRHRLVLEDGESLRLLEGVMPSDLGERRVFSLAGSPTRFGRVALSAEPSGIRGWKARYTREKAAPAPQSVRIPAWLSAGASFTRVEGAATRKLAQGSVEVDPAAEEWTALWES
jgi:hypothetical protein